MAIKLLGCAWVLSLSIGVWACPPGEVSLDTESQAPKVAPLVADAKEKTAHTQGTPRGTSAKKTHKGSPSGEGSHSGGGAGSKSSSPTLGGNPVNLVSQVSRLTSSSPKMAKHKCVKQVAFDFLMAIHRANTKPTEWGASPSKYEFKASEVELAHLLFSEGGLEKIRATKSKSGYFFAPDGASVRYYVENGNVILHYPEKTLGSGTYKTVKTRIEVGTHEGREVLRDRVELEFSEAGEKLHEAAMWQLVAQKQKEGGLPFPDVGFTHVEVVELGGSDRALIMQRMSGDLYHMGTEKLGFVETFQLVSKQLANLHSMNIVHGDFKAENILIDREGKPMITDLGLSHALDRGKVRNSRTSAHVEAPEMIPPAEYPSFSTPDGIAARKARDIYGLGVEAYHFVVPRLLDKNGVKIQTPWERCHNAALRDACIKGAAQPFHEAMAAAAKQKCGPQPNCIYNLIAASVNPSPLLRPTALDWAGMVHAPSGL